MAASISKTLSKSRLHASLALLQRHSAPSASPLSPFSTASSSISAASDPLSNPTSHPQNRARQRGILSKILLFIPGAITFGLGTWQIFRRQDKIKMLEYRRERLEMEPIQLNAISPVNDSNILEFRRVVCKGVFDEKKSVFVGPRSRSISGVTENGYYLITPLLPIPGDPESVQSPVLVNRGWVPRSWRDRALQSLKDVEEARDVHSPTSLHVEKHSFWRFWSKKPEKSEEKAPSISLVEVIGVIRGSEKPSIFVPENDPSSAQWFYVDVPAIARAAGLPENVTYIEDINENVSPSNPYPIPKDANSLIRSSVMPQDHLNYTLTWYSLSAAVTFMAYKRLQPRSRRR
uniref:SURF1-like protein n=1 Tax=Opuntia streptacantha TaxID=393608 RepID=A0A7C9A4B5_OPUST